MIQRKISSGTKLINIWHRSKVIPIVSHKTAKCNSLKFGAHLFISKYDVTGHRPQEIPLEIPLENNDVNKFGDEIRTHYS